MRNVLDCINAFIPLLSTEYELVLGRKGVSVTLRISFDKKIVSSYGITISGRQT